jgi:hypothetical protein
MEDQLARYIRKGLRNNVQEDSNVLFLVESEEGKLRGSVIGIALVGAVGCEEACKLSRTATRERIKSEQGGPVFQQILRLLRISYDQFEKLVEAHSDEMEADRIANDLSLGNFAFN